MRKRKNLNLLIIFAMIGFLISGCSQPSQVVITPEEKPTADQFEFVRQATEDYLAGDRVASLTPEQLYKEYFQEKNGDYLLVDIRTQGDFTHDNIRGSINIPYTQTANIKKLANLPQDKTLVVIDYNGHWAAQTAATWNMLGLKAVPLLYGMQSWTTNQVSLGYDTFPEEALNNPLVAEESSLGQYNLPELKIPEGTTEEIIRRLSGTYLDRNYKGFVTADEVLTSLNEGTSDYLVDIRQPEHYGKGHIKGSVNIPLDQLAKTEMLKYLPLDEKIILIGYDGMDASQGVRSLVTMGYNAEALKYGMSYWHGDEEVTGVSPVHNLVQDYYELIPLNYVQPAAGAASCG
ncbi:MAG: rhodanese [Gracilibacter sp. BRH_c7a]|nr:MAG: rhodanese [Gracilibacter sp. BRH_c7a]